jgi:hypothetical protein
MTRRARDLAGRCFLPESGAGNTGLFTGAITPLVGFPFPSAPGGIHPAPRQKSRAIPAESTARWRVTLLGAFGTFCLVGSTLSANFPRLNAIQSTFGGVLDGIMVKIAP